MTILRVRRGWLDRQEARILDIAAEREEVALLAGLDIANAARVNDRGPALPWSRPADDRSGVMVPRNVAICAKKLAGVDEWLSRIGVECQNVARDLLMRCARKVLFVDSGAEEELGAFGRRSFKFLVTETQRSRVFRGLQAINKASPSRPCHAHSLAKAALEYLAGTRHARLGWTCDGPLRPIRLPLYEDQVLILDDALRAARDAGCLTTGWALAEICSSALRYGGAVATSCPDSWPDSGQIRS